MRNFYSMRRNKWKTKWFSCGNLDLMYERRQDMMGLGSEELCCSSTATYITNLCRKQRILVSFERPILSEGDEAHSN